MSENKQGHKEKIEHIEIPVTKMVCESCEKIIETAVRAKEGIKEISVDYADGKAFIAYDTTKISEQEIKEAIKKEGYGIGAPHQEKPQHTKSQENGTDNKNYFLLGAIILMGLFVGYYLVETFFGGMNLSIPQLDASTSAAIIFIVGLLTGFHCIGMCGGFVLGYTAKSRQENPKSLNLKAHAQYSTGKIISYTLIGGIFGLVGSIFVFSTELRAAIAIIAGIFLILFALKMLNAHPILRKMTIPQSIFSKFKIGPLKSNNNPLIVGLANGLFIACGPLQAMYILAMGTASPLGGAIVLAAFAIGTLIPMMAFGIFASFISRGMQHHIVTISAIIVLIMGILMINNGLILTGTNVTTGFTTQNLSTTPQNQNTPILTSNTQSTSNGPGYQVIKMDVTTSGYSPNSFILKKGVPVKWVINGKEITSCNNSIIVNAYNLKFNIKQGEQTIEFTPDKTGIINWSCWMGMLQGTFIVREDVSIDSSGNVVTTPQVQQAAAQQKSSAPKQSGGCGCAMMSGNGGGCTAK